MSRPMNTARRRQLTLVAGAAFIMLVLALGASWQDARRNWQPAVEGPVLPDWPQAVASAQSIEIDSAEDHFTLQRTETGWVMPERDGHPVRSARLAELDAFLSGLEYAGARTTDPDKHARLGLAADGAEGVGTRVTVRDLDGAVTADIILGDMRQGRAYVRFPQRNRSWAARPGETASERPAIETAQDWLDLDFLALGSNEIARADIAPEQGPAYRLERAARSTRNFALRQPAGWRPITAAAGNGPASVLSRVRFRDVRRADRIAGEVIARHTAQTFTGLQVTLEIIALGETRWARLEASALTDDAQAEAAAINAAAEGWAFLLSDLTLDRLVRPLDQIADPVGGDDAP